MSPLRLDVLCLDIVLAAEQWLSNLLGEEFEFHKSAVFCWFSDASYDTEKQLILTQNTGVS